MRDPAALLLASMLLSLSACKDATTPTTGSHPSISIADVTVDEGTGGTTDAVFVVTLSETSSAPVTVNYATSSGTALVQDDFEDTSGKLIVPSGSSSGQVIVPVVSDIVGEAATESFTVVLSGAVNGTIGDDTAVGTITDDDDCDPIATLGTGDAVAGSLADTDCRWTADTDYYDMYLVHLGDSTDIAVDRTSNAQDFDPYVALFSLDGTSTVQSDDDGYELNGRIVVRVSPGTFVVFAAASSSTGETGDYKLSMTEVPSGATFYGTTSVSSATSSLYTIDPTSGAETLVGDTGFDRVGALAFHPTTRALYGEGARTADGVRVLISIDRDTGAGTEIGETGVAAAADLAFRSDGVLYMYGSAHDVYTVDTTTGAATLLGPSGLSLRGGNGIAFNASDVLYHSDGIESHTVDDATGAATPVADMDFPLPCQTTLTHSTGGRFAGADRPAGFAEFYGVVKCDSNSDSPATYLGQASFASGYVILIGQSADNLDGFAVLN